MADLKLITKNLGITPPNPPQSGNPPEYFGEQSNDIQLDGINDFATISGLTKLKQDIEKAILTERGKNLFFELYGTTLQNSVGGKVSVDVITATIKDQIISALQVLEFVNRENTNPDERPQILEFLSVELIDNDKVEIQISVITDSNKRVSSGLIISVA